MKSVNNDLRIALDHYIRMRVIAVLNQKGGSGKTTIASNLAVALHRRGHRVAVVDADSSQGTVREWGDRSEDAPIVLSAQEPALEDHIPPLKGAFDFVVIDGAPHVEDMARSAILAADLVLIPVRPSAADIWSAEDIVDLVQARREVAGAPQAAFVVSQQVLRSNLADSVNEALSSFDAPVLEARTSSRVAYAEALGAGLSVLDLDDAKAVQEIEALTDEVLTYLNA